MLPERQGMKATMATPKLLVYDEKRNLGKPFVVRKMRDIVASVSSSADEIRREAKAKPIRFTAFTDGHDSCYSMWT